MGDELVMLQIKNIFLLVLMSFLLSACFDGDNSSSSKSSTQTRTFSDVDNLLLNYTQQTLVQDANGQPRLNANGETQPFWNGVSIIVVDKNDGVIHKSYQGSHQEGQLFHGASISKMVSSVVLTALSEDPEVDFDISQPIDDYLGYTGSLQGRGITVEHALANVAGIPGLVSFDDLGDIANTSVSFVPYLCQYITSVSAEQCAQDIYGAELFLGDIFLTQPGTEYRYGGAQWQLAGHVGEKVSGLTWNELVNKYLKTPCGIEQLTYGNMYFNLVTLPFLYPPVNTLQDVIGQQAPLISGGIVVTLEEYAKILMMQLNDGMCGDNEVISKAGIDSIREDRYPASAKAENPNVGYGLGTRIKINDAGQAEYYNHGGAFGARWWYDIERGYGALLIFEKLDLIAVNQEQTRNPFIDEQLIPLVEQVIDAR